MTRANEHHGDHRDRGGGTVFVLRLHAPNRNKCQPRRLATESGAKVQGK